MKIKQLILSGTALITVLSLSLTGCRPDRDKDNDTSGAEDNSLADKSFEDMAQIANEAATGAVNSFKNGNYDGLLSICANVSHDTANNKIVVDFGPTNCYCNDGRYRRGKVFISYNGNSYWDSLATVTISSSMAGDPSSDTYYVNDNQVIGTKTVSNKGHNTAGHMNWDVQVTGTINKANGQGTVQWQSTRNREWSAGENTPLIWSDDEYSVTGSGSGTSANGTPFTVQITSKLVRKMNCPKHFVSGTFDFTPGTKPVRHVDFSPPNNGQCDNVATVTINNNTYTVYLK